MKKVLIFFSFFLMVSCEEQANDLSLNINDTITLPKEDYVISPGLSSSYVELNNKSYLFYRTPNIHNYNNEILVYNLETKKLEGKNVFSKENGFASNISSFIHISNDSIILFSKKDSIYIVDSKLNVKKKIKFKFDYKGEVISQIDNYTLNPTHYENGNLIFSPIYYDENNENYKNKSFIFKYNINSGKFINYSTIFPDSFINSEYFYPYFYNCFDDENIIYSPANSHKIWVVNKKTEKLVEYEMGSDYFREFKSSKKLDRQLTMQDYQYINSYYSRYSVVAYDKYNKVYYRFFYPGHDVKLTDKNLVELNRNPKRIAIIVFDKNFKKIGETIFENKNLSNSYFISPNGLHIALISKSELSDNDKLKYVKLNLNYEKN